MNENTKKLEDAKLTVVAKLEYPDGRVVEVETKGNVYNTENLVFDRKKEGLETHTEFAESFIQFHKKQLADLMEACEEEAKKNSCREEKEG